MYAACSAALLLDRGRCAATVTSVTRELGVMADIVTLLPSARLIKAQVRSYHPSKWWYVVVAAKEAAAPTNTF